MIIKLFAAGFVLLAATSSIIITSYKKRANQGSFRIGLGVVLLCIALLFFLFR